MTYQPTAQKSPQDAARSLEQLAPRFAPLSEIPGFTPARGDAAYLASHGVQLGIYQGVAAVRFADKTRAISLIQARSK